MIRVDFGLDERTVANAGSPDRWQLIWVGNIEPNSSGAGYRVAVWFRPVFSGKPPVLDHLILRKVDTGYLPVLQGGSLWTREGRLIEQDDDKTFKSIKLAERSFIIYPDSTFGKKPVEGVSVFKSCADPIVKLSHQAALPVEALTSLFFKFRRGYPKTEQFFSKQKNLSSRPCTILIPVVEVARFYYFISSKVTDAIITDNLANLVNVVVKSDDTITVELTESVTDAEILVLAQITGFAKATQAIKLLRNTIVMNKVNGTNKPVVTDFPFVVNSKITAQGYYIDADDHYFLVSRLTDSENQAPSPFRQITALLPKSIVSSGGEAGQIRTITPILTPKTRISSDTGSNPSLKPQATEIYLNNKLVDRLDEPYTLDKKYSVESEQPTQVRDADFEEVDTLSTQHFGEPINQPIAQVNILQSKPIQLQVTVETLPVDPKNLFVRQRNALNELKTPGEELRKLIKSSLPTIDIEFIALNNPCKITDPAESVAFFPSQTIQTEYPDKLFYCYYSLETRPLRPLLIAHVQMNQRNFYWIEIDTTGVSSVNLVVVAHKDFSVIAESVLNELLLAFVEHGMRWKALEDNEAAPLSALKLVTKRCDHQTHKRRTRYEDESGNLQPLEKIPKESITVADDAFKLYRRMNELLSHATLRPKRTK